MSHSNRIETQEGSHVITFVSELNAKVEEPSTTTDTSPYIFLDVDGVLHPLAENGLPLGSDCDLLAARFDSFDASDNTARFNAAHGEFILGCLTVLKEIVDRTNAKVFI